MLDRIIHGDCLQHLPAIPNACIDLVFADPPFNIGFRYDNYNDKRTAPDYLHWTNSWLAQIRRILKPTGSIFVAIGDRYAAEIKTALENQGFHFRNWIIWHFTFGAACRSKFTGSKTHIFYYSANPKRFTFNADAIRVTSQRLQARDKRGNPLGKIPDDAWSFSRIAGTHKERTPHPCQMPEAILERIIKVASNPGDLVLDPFAGSGTTLSVAKRLGRRFLGYEISQAYVDLVNERLAKT